MQERPEGRAYPFLELGKEAHPYGFCSMAVGRGWG